MGRSWRTAALLPVLLLALAAKPAPPAAAVRGERLAVVLGCKSCHGAALDGNETFHDPTIAVLYTSNLSRAVPGYSDRELNRVIRTGVRPDGSRLWRMAAAPYAALRPSDMHDLIAYLRTVPHTGELHPRVVIGPRFKRAADAGLVRPEGLDLERDLAHPAPDLGPKFARGRLLPERPGTKPSFAGATGNDRCRVTLAFDDLAEQPVRVTYQATDRSLEGDAQTSYLSAQRSIYVRRCNR